MHLLGQLLYRLAISLRAFREEGLRAGLVELGQTVLRIFYQQNEYIVVAKVLSDQVLLPDPKPGLVIRQIESREEIARLSQIADLADVARFYTMFDNGSTGFTAFQDDQVVGYCWASQETDRSVNRVQPPLRPGDACVHDLFVSPAHRGQGVGQALVSHRLRFLRERGYKRAIAIVLEDNVPALKVDKKAGYAHSGEMSHIRILFWDSYHYDIPDA